MLIGLAGVFVVDASPTGAMAMLLGALAGMLLCTKLERFLKGIEPKAKCPRCSVSWVAMRDACWWCGLRVGQLPEAGDE